MRLNFSVVMEIPLSLFIQFINFLDLFQNLWCFIQFCNFSNNRYINRILQLEKAERFYDFSEK